MARGLLDTEGHVVHPPPYFDVDAYLGSIRTLQALRPARLLTAHYDVVEGEAVDRFLAESEEFVADVERVVAAELDAAGQLTLEELLARADPQLGPFSSMPNELAGPLRAHLRRRTRDGQASLDGSGLVWSVVNDTRRA